MSNNLTIANRIPKTGNEENHQFRILYAIAIILVVAGHCGNGGMNVLFDWFTPYAFHLGIFAFGSGYFYKIKECDRQFDYLKRKIKHLLIPLFLCNLFYGILVEVMRPLGMSIGGGLNFQNLIITPMQHGHQFVYNLGTWFVFPLFVIVIFNNILFKLLAFLGERRAIVTFILYLALGIISVKLAKNGYNKEWYLLLTKTMFLMPMFGLGLLYRKYRFFDSLNNGLFLFIVLTLQYLLLLRFGCPVGNNIAWMRDFHGSSYLPFVAEFLGIMFWLRMCAIVEPVLKSNKLINEIGSHTFEIMTHHLLAMVFIKAIFALAALKLSLNFSFEQFTHNIGYYYCPKSLWQTHFFYALAGVLLPIYYVRCKTALLKKFNNQKLNN